ELGERDRRGVRRRIEPPFVEGAISDCAPQFVECDLGFFLGVNLAIRPFREAHPLATEAAPPCVSAAIASTPGVRADFVQPHASSFQSDVVYFFIGSLPPAAMLSVH